MFISKELLIICPLIFLAGFIDSIAGGGGLISIPAYLVALPGVNTHSLLGTNKFSAVWGTLISSIKYAKSKKVHYKSVLISFITSFIGSKIGSKLVLYINEAYVKYLIIVLTPLIAIFILTKKNFGEEKIRNLSMKKILILSGISSLFIGMYDGFYGPGTGTFLIIVFTTVIGFDVVTASGNAKLINLASNLAAVTTFITSGNVLYYIAIPAAISSVLGNYLGSHLAIKNGKKIIKPLFIVVLALLLITSILQLLGVF